MSGETRVNVLFVYTTVALSWTITVSNTMAVLERHAIH